MLRVKLQALEHPTPDNLNIKDLLKDVIKNTLDRAVFASTILWLEDQKIRQYKIEDREALRKVDNLPQWEQAYKQYKCSLGMPNFKTPIEELSYLCSFAVRLEFLDAPENFKDINSQQNTTKAAAPSIKAENFYDNLDFNHKDFIAGVRALANKLKVPHHPDHLMQLEAIARIVHERMSPAAKNRQAITGKPFPFEKGADIVAAGDATLDYPVRILRLLQIQSLRELQTRINEAIVAVQDLTANPKTDTKLGKVGR